MKRLVFLAFVAMLAVSSVSAQFSVDREGIEKKIAKSEADIQHAKRSLKSSTWITRGDNYFEAATAPTTGTYLNMGLHEAKIMFGSKAVKKSITMEGQRLDMYSFKYFNG